MYDVSRILTAPWRRPCRCLRSTDGAVRSSTSKATASRSDRGARVSGSRRRRTGRTGVRPQHDRGAEVRLTHFTPHASAQRQPRRARASGRVEDRRGPARQRAARVAWVHAAAEAGERRMNEARQEGWAPRVSLRGLSRIPATRSRRSRSSRRRPTKCAMFSWVTRPRSSVVRQSKMEAIEQMGL